MSNLEEIKAKHPLAEMIKKTQWQAARKSLNLIANS